MNAWQPIALCLVLAGCVSEPAPGSPDSYRDSVARSLGYFEGTPKRYMISGPLQTVIPGRLNVCVREKMDDGRGGAAPGAMQVMFVEQGRVVESHADNNCSYRDYTDLQPVRR